MVQGTVSGDSVTATKINDGVGTGMRGGGRTPGVFGTVSADQRHDADRYFQRHGRAQ